jgi:hypothetical protein
MNGPIIVENERVDEETLTRLVNDVQRLTGAKVSVRLRTQWVVECDNYPVSLALQTLLAGRQDVPSKHANKASDKQKAYAYRPGSETAASNYKKKATDEPQGEYTLKPGEPREIKAWRLMDGDTVVETLTIEEKNKRLAEGGFAEGAILHHPKAGKQRVIGAGPGQGMEPVQ